MSRTLAINLIKHRLRGAFGEALQFEEKGQPTDFRSAQRLAELDKFQFQHWALSLINARPLREGDGKGADRGVDGLLFFYESKDERRKLIVQVKGGGVKRGDVATLLGDVNNQKAAGGILLILEKPTGPMRDEAADAGRYQSKLWHDKDYPKIQILTIAGLFEQHRASRCAAADESLCQSPARSQAREAGGLDLRVLRDRRLVSPTLQGPLLGKEIGTSQAILPVVVCRIRAAAFAQPHI